MINYVGFKHYNHKDLSQSQFYTLSPKTVDILNNLDSPSPSTPSLTSEMRDRRRKSPICSRNTSRPPAKTSIVEKIDPAYDITRAAELQKKLHFDGNDHLVIFEYKDRRPASSNRKTCSTSTP